MTETTNDSPPEDAPGAPSESPDPPDRVRQAVSRAIHRGHSARELAATLDVDLRTLGGHFRHSGILSDLDDRASQQQHDELRRQTKALQLDAVRQLRARLRPGGLREDADLEDQRSHLNLEVPSWSDLSLLMRLSRELREFIDEELSTLRVVS